jgi:hypothetical protein
MQPLQLPSWGPQSMMFTERLGGGRKVDLVLGGSVLLFGLLLPLHWCATSRHRASPRANSWFIKPLYWSISWAAPYLLWTTLWLHGCRAASLGSFLHRPAHPPHGAHQGHVELVWIWVPLISIGGLTVLMVFVSECETGRERSWGLHVPKMP